MADLAPGLVAAIGPDWPTPDSQAPKLRALIYEQFKQSNWAVPLANAIGAGASEWQAAALAMLALLSLDTVTDNATDPAYGIGRGLQLDRIGRIVGQPRGLATDAEYRPLLGARVLANRSCGGPATLLQVFFAAFAGVGTPTYAPGWIAAYTLRLVGVVVDPLLVTALLGLLASSTQAGVRGVLEYSTTAPAATMTWNATGTTQGWGDATSAIVGGALAGAAAP